MTTKDVKKEILDGIFRSKDGLSSNELTMLLNTLIEVTKKEAISEHEQIQWKKYPENKPKNGGYYLIIDNSSMSCRYDVDTFINGDWYFHDNRGGKIIAFRELPKAYQEIKSQ